MSLQIFGGTLTEITCSADAPLFHLMEQDAPFNQLPDFISVGRSPTGNSVTLYISGTNRSNNVTVICGNDLASGISLADDFQPLFTLTLDFVGKFTNQA